MKVSVVPVACNNCVEYLIIKKNSNADAYRKLVATVSEPNNARSYEDTANWLPILGNRLFLGFWDRQGVKTPMKRLENAQQNSNSEGAYLIRVLSPKGPKKSPQYNGDFGVWPRLRLPRGGVKWEFNFLFFFLSVFWRLG